MAEFQEKLTDQTENNDFTDDNIFYHVNPNDPSQHPSGSGFFAKFSAFKAWLLSGLQIAWENVTTKPAVFAPDYGAENTLDMDSGAVFSAGILTIPDTDGLIHLTSTNASETITGIDSNTPYKVRIKPEVGLIITIQNSATIKTEGELDIVIDGDFGDYAEFIKEDGVWKQYNVVNFEESDTGSPTGYKANLVETATSITRLALVYDSLVLNVRGQVVILQEGVNVKQMDTGEVYLIIGTDLSNASSWELINAFALGTLSADFSAEKTVIASGETVLNSAGLVRQVYYMSIYWGVGEVINATSGKTVFTGISNAVMLSYSASFFGYVGGGIGGNLSGNAYPTLVRDVYMYPNNVDVLFELAPVKVDKSFRVIIKYYFE